MEFVSGSPQKMDIFLCGNETCRRVEHGGTNRWPGSVCSSWNISPSRQRNWIHQLLPDWCITYLDVIPWLQNETFTKGCPHLHVCLCSGTNCVFIFSGFVLVAELCGLPSRFMIEQIEVIDYIHFRLGLVQNYFRSYTALVEVTITWSCSFTRKHWNEGSCSSSSHFLMWGHLLKLAT